MAANGSSDSFAPDTILAAMTTMRGGEPDKKKVAMDYLTKFQKSVGTARRRYMLFEMPRLYCALLTRLVERCLDDDPHDLTVQRRSRGHAVRSDNAEGKGTTRPGDIPHTTDLD